MQNPKEPEKAEQCRNPWNTSCTNTNITVYIVYRGERLPICSNCWDTIAESEAEWGEETAQIQKEG